MKLRTISTTCPVVGCDEQIELPVTTSWPPEPYRKHGNRPTLVVTLTADLAPFDTHLLDEHLIDRSAQRPTAADQGDHGQHAADRDQGDSDPEQSRQCSGRDQADDHGDQAEDDQHNSGGQHGR